jgi:hypothetical protein
MSFPEPTVVHVDEPAERQVGPGIVRRDLPQPVSPARG